MSSTSFSYLSDFGFCQNNIKVKQYHGDFVVSPRCSRVPFVTFWFCTVSADQSLSEMFPSLLQTL